MKTVEQIALSVLMVALLTVVGLVVLPGVSRAQSALQVVAIEGSGSRALDNSVSALSELRITNPTTMPLCANVYSFYPDGDPAGCGSVLVPPFGSMDDYSLCVDPEDCYFDFEGSFFIVSGVQPPNHGECNPYVVGPKAGLRSWLMLDENGAVGINAQDAVLSSGMLPMLMRACYPIS